MFINLIQQRFTPWLITLLLSACIAVAISSNTQASIIKPSSYTEIQALFTAEDYHWDNLHQGVPDIRLHCFPADLNDIDDIQEKKQLFYMSLLPMVLAQNNAIQQQRLTLKQILHQWDSFGSITLRQQAWLQKLGQQYHCNVAPLGSTKVKARLLSRVNVVPVALVMAQAANESAYGTSRFARIANNIFGEWTFKVGTGIVPHQRSSGQRYEVRKFATLSDSLSSYFNNINTHRAYKKLRDVRQQMCAAGEPIDAQKLAEGLINYSTRRDAYVAEIQAMIRYNRLGQLSALELRSKQMQNAEQPLRKDIAGSILRISELSARASRLSENRGRSERPEV